MARICLLVLTAGLLVETYGIVTGYVEDNTGSVFVSQKLASTVLRRQRRYNHGLEEVLHKDNLERECMEERCNMEEAREVFENDELTMEFWAPYSDGDQCDSAPCQNGAKCKDGINSYVCFCPPDFNGKNCEIEIAKQCSVNNGGCAHFCVMEYERAMCHCAVGYKLQPDMRTCKPTVDFPCGRVSESIITSSRSVYTQGTSETSGKNSTGTLHYDDYGFNSTLEYEYEDTSHPFAPAVNSTVSTSEVIINSTSSSAVQKNATEMPPTETTEEKQPFWASPTMPAITAERNVDQRIVGGNEATPGEIPWQVTLMRRSDHLPFCGGTLLSEVWVITAAHCLSQTESATEDYFIRMGEHDVHQTEGHEKDHMVELQVIHKSYESQKSKYNHDIALLKLREPVELSAYRLPICLGPKDFTEVLMRESPTSLVSGWGNLKHKGRQATRLMKLEVPYVERTKCKSSSRDHITRFMFCAGYSNEEKDSCQGDSGGPHTTNYQGTWFLTGIVSWGEECAKAGKYGVYTRVSRYYPWISQVTGLHFNSSQ